MAEASAVKPALPPGGFEMRSLISALCCLALAGAATASPTRMIASHRTWTAAELGRFSDRWVHVKFVEGSEVNLVNGRFIDDARADLDEINAAIAGAISIRPTFDVDHATAREWKSLGEAQSGVIGPDLSLWFSVRVSGGAPAVAELLNRLNASPLVEVAEPEPIVELASMTESPSSSERAPLTQSASIPAPANPLAETPLFTAQQGYLFAPPVGLAVPTVWSYPGGNGAGEHFIDVELAWTENHEDYPFERHFYHGGASEDPGQDYINHGTAVLGEVVGQQNSFGVNGIAPGVDGYGVVAITVAEWPTVPAYFQEAIDHLSAGDVWLIELQMYPPGRSATPMEWLQVNYDVIWTGVFARGVVCVEAGANGSQNLDEASWGGVFDRNQRDSGAIMVAAGTPSGLVAEWFTNYGSRMDVHAWGSAIVTTGYGDLWNGGTAQRIYTASFGGTSGASPMVTGGALCLQGVARSALGAPLTPIELRSILHDTGTAFAGSLYIGPRPNLGAAGAAVMGLATDVPAAGAAAARVRVAPNPFAREVSVVWSAPVTMGAKAEVFDLAGRMVRALSASPAPGGATTIRWDGTNGRSERLSNGVYFVRLTGAEARARVQLLR